MRQASELVEEIKSRLDIVDVLSDYLELRRAGQNYRALCPFHAEKTPSFVVSPEKQLYHCFGCGAGGDLIGFLMRHEGLSFPEALRALARRAGLRVEEFSGPRGPREQLLEILQEAQDFYRQALRQRKDVLEYLLKHRALEPQSLERFALGYAPEGPRALYEHLLRKGFSKALVLQSGLCQRGQWGPYDFLRHRVVFPIQDAQGRVVAFGGRLLQGEGPKYLNSPETGLFKKGQTLYGLYQAREALRRSGSALLVEGYTDVLMCQQYGFGHAVAPLGTALTEGHLRVLRRYASRVVLLFDSDRAGLQAARRALALCLEAGMLAQVVLLPEGQDPDSLLRTQGAQALREALERSLEPMAFVLRSFQGHKVEALREALGLLQRTGDALLREELLRELSEVSGLREEALREELRKLRAPREVPGPTPQRRRHTEETLLLSVYLSVPELRDYIQKALKVEHLGDEMVREVFLSLSREGRVPPDAPSEQQALLSWLALEPGFDPQKDDPKGIARQCLRRLSHRSLLRQIQQARASGDLRLLGKLLREQKRRGSADEERGV
jgi:DNA primase